MELGKALLIFLALGVFSTFIFAVIVWCSCIVAGWNDDDE